MAKRRKGAKSQRLPSGLYAYRGKARPFSSLPKSEQTRWRSLRATRAQSTIRQRRAETVVVRRPAIKEDSWLAKKNGDVYDSDRMPGQSIRDVIMAIRDDQKRDSPFKEKGVWIATVEWPQDPRSSKGEPWRHEVSLPPHVINTKDYHTDMIQFLQTLEETEGANLNPEGESKGRGTANVIDIRFVVFD